MPDFLSSLLTDEGLLKLGEVWPGRNGTTESGAVGRVGGLVSGGVGAGVSEGAVRVGSYFCSD